MTTTPNRQVMVTGHRQIPNEAGIAAALHLILERMLAREPLTAISGMALGTDMLFAEAALDLGIPFIAAVPMAEQPNRWPAGQVARWQGLLGRAAEVVEVWKQPGYEATGFAAQFNQRNLWMLDHSEVVIAVWSGQEHGGTWHTVRTARQRGRQFLIVDPTTCAIRSSAVH